MEEIIKIDYFDRERFTIYYISDINLRTEEELKSFFKMLNNYLLLKYDCGFNGFYEVNIFSNQGIYVLDFKNIGDYGRSDFDITMFLNCVILYEFEDSDLIRGEKVYYKNKYYVEVENMLDNIYLFENGNIVYGKEVDEILNNGILLSK